MQEWQFCMYGTMWEKEPEKHFNNAGDGGRRRETAMMVRWCLKVNWAGAGQGSRCDGQGPANGGAGPLARGGGATRRRWQWQWQWGPPRWERRDRGTPPGTTSYHFLGPSTSAMQPSYTGEQTGAPRAPQKQEKSSNKKKKINNSTKKAPLRVSGRLDAETHYPG